MPEHSDERNDGEEGEEVGGDKDARVGTGLVYTA
jgi:hypothetical protein